MSVIETVNREQLLVVSSNTRTRGYPTKLARGMIKVNQVGFLVFWVFFNADTSQQILKVENSVSEIP